MFTFTPGSSWFGLTDHNWSFYTDIGVVVVVVVIDVVVVVVAVVVVFVVIVVVVVVSFWIGEKPRRKWRKTFGEVGCLSARAKMAMIFCQVRIYYLHDKCVVFARNC